MSVELPRSPVSRKRKGGDADQKRGSTEGLGVLTAQESPEASQVPQRVWLCGATCRTDSVLCAPDAMSSHTFGGKRIRSSGKRRMYSKTSFPTWAHAHTSTHRNSSLQVSRSR